MFNRCAVFRVGECINHHQNLRSVGTECAYKQWNLHIERQIVNLFLLHGHCRGQPLRRQTAQLGRVRILYRASEVIRLYHNDIFRIDSIAFRLEPNRSAAFPDFLRIDREKTVIILVPHAAIPFITLDFNSVGIRMIAGKFILHRLVNL